MKKDIAEQSKKLREQKRKRSKRGISSPHTYAHEYSTLTEYSTIYGISQREKQLDEIPTFKSEIQVRIEKFLVQKIKKVLHAYGWKEQGSNC